MKLNKKIIMSVGGLMAFVLVFAMVNINIYASSKPIVNINDGVDIPTNVVNDIVKSNPDAGLITIMSYDYINNGEIDNSIKPDMFTILVPIITTTSKTYTYRDIEGKDVFVTSVAKGQTTELSQDFTASLSSSISNAFNIKQLGLNATVTKKYASKTAFAGPPESSYYNSREYRVKFYQDIGNFTQSKTYDFKNFTYTNGTFVEPTKSAAYSIDKRY